MEVKENWKNGKLDGLRESFHDNGKICSRFAYKNGKESGINEWFDEQGFKLNRDMIRTGSFSEKAFNLLLWIDPTSPRSFWKKINEKK